MKFGYMDGGREEHRGARAGGSHILRLSVGLAIVSVLSLFALAASRGLEPEGASINQLPLASAPLREMP